MLWEINEFLCALRMREVQCVAIAKAPWIPDDHGDPSTHRQHGVSNKPYVTLYVFLSDEQITNERALLLLRKSSAVFLKSKSAKSSLMLYFDGP